jgi:hypothetical protein
MRSKKKHENKNTTNPVFGSFCFGFRFFLDYKRERGGERRRRRKRMREIQKRRENGNANTARTGWARST